MLPFDYYCCPQDAGRVIDNKRFLPAHQDCDDDIPRRALLAANTLTYTAKIESTTRTDDECILRADANGNRRG